MLSLSTLELRNIIESSFLPMRCQCTLGADESLTVKVFDKKSERVDLVVTGICASKLDSNRAISELIAELRYDLEHGQDGHYGEARARAR
ncbi:DUF1652 domain-containing protein [Pseudomonas gingeri NCPPB 3146 = LMG 5327]|uniref:DUF1652 domain-containing protein n=2 Tax=Pseudomonas gingeri TaxID=117681 RepID=A0A7Y8CD74_9PSED|nr:MULTISPECIES: DUF1652 domain-containing protein [Pseudomonas]NVZ24171.1 DUF1652 domain-containing protein [Pseudomonas gingeri]NVZ67019.1 DUF1652 domain-containing protein [Pseudomonas gingeri]NVZ73536.1 DUF1652 domain-containing protein [Pseudomonas gingeri]NWA11163.1 DUF1652 domain-containing protein [Pseudomonas gingeri]NWC13752.1 DUF1652 domain-containing protein [Pseudomonas gingeri]